MFNLFQPTSQATCQKEILNMFMWIVY